MSYDISYRIDTGNGESVEVYDINMTSNVAPVWRAAGIDLKDFHGKPTPELVAASEKALEKLTGDLDHYHQFVRGDGEWGNVNSVVFLLGRLIVEGKKHPNTRVTVGY